MPQPTKAVGPTPGKGSVLPAGEGPEEKELRAPPHNRLVCQRNAAGARRLPKATGAVALLGPVASALNHGCGGQHASTQTKRSNRAVISGKTK